MSIAVTAAKGFAHDVSQPSRQKGIYTIVMTVTGLAADVDHDIGDLSGNFWTEALADSTYGEIAALAKAKFSELDGQVTHVVENSPELNTSFVRVAGAPSGATEYQLSNRGATTKVADIAFFADNAPTSYAIQIDFSLDIEKYLPAAFDAGF